MTEQKEQSAQASALQLLKQAVRDVVQERLKQSSERAELREILQPPVPQGKSLVLRQL